MLTVNNATTPRQTTGRTIPLVDLVLLAGNALPVTMTTALRTVFGLDFVDASAIMAEAVREGSAFITSEPTEHAEFHQDRLNDYSVTSYLEDSNALHPPAAYSNSTR